MLFGKSKLELKVGIFVFIGLVILMIFVLSIGGFKTWSSGYYVNFEFKFVNGVKIGAPVRFAGMDVGQVKKLSLVHNPEIGTKVMILGWVKKDVIIPLDSQVWVNTLGLLGEKYIEIMPGKDYQNYALANQVLIGNDPIAMHEVAELAKNIAADLDGMILKINKGEGTIGKLLSDDTIYNEMESLVLDLKKHPWKLFWKGKDK